MQKKEENDCSMSRLVLNIISLRQLRPLLGLRVLAFVSQDTMTTSTIAALQIAHPTNQ